MVRFGADCVEKTRGVVLVGNLRQQKPGRYWKIGIRLVTGTGTPLGAYAGWEKLHRQAAARGRLVGQRRIAENGLSRRLNWEERRMGRK